MTLSRTGSSAEDADQGRVCHVTACNLVAVNRPWLFAQARAAEIDAHWRQCCLESPSLFNGVVYMLSDYEVQAGVLRGRLFPAEFKAFLYWKNNGAPDRSIYDIFGSALLRTEDGSVLLGRQRAGNINAGLFYLPGGFIDHRDVACDGLVDVRASVLREVREETGLAEPMLQVGEGFLVTFIGQQISIAVDLGIRSSASVAIQQIEASLRQQGNPELEAIVAIRSPADLAALDVPNYARVLLTHQLKAD